MATILVADDHATSRRYLTSLLRGVGHRVVEACDGLEGLDATRRETPDVVITDILMPGMDGYELVRRLREAPASRAVPVIFCTAHYHRREAVGLANAGGVMRILVEPCEPQDVIDAVTEALGRSGPPVAPPADFSERHLRVLTDKLADNVDRLRSVSQRLDAVLDLTHALASEPDPMAVLDRACAGARCLLGAHVCGIGILREDCPGFGPLLQVDGSGGARLTREPLAPDREPLAGVLREGRSLRSPGSSPDEAVLASPIVSPSRRYGAIWLLGKVGSEEFTHEEDEALQALAAQVAVAYENALRLAEIRRRSVQLEEEVAQRRRAEESLRGTSEELRAIAEALAYQVEEGDWLRATARLLEAAGRRTGSPDAAAAFHAKDGAVIAVDRAGRCSPTASEELRRCLATLEAAGPAPGAGRGPGVAAADAACDPLLPMPIRQAGRLVGVLAAFGRAGGYRSGEEESLRALAAAAGLIHESHERAGREVELTGQLRHAQRMEVLGTLAGSVAHDFNNLLTAVTGFSDLTLSGLPPDNALRRNVEEIRAAARRATALTRQLLCMSRRRAARPSLLDLNEVVREMESLVERLVGEAIDPRFDLAPGPVRLIADPCQVEQVILNLVVNARDAMPSGGRLTVAVGIEPPGDASAPGGERSAGSGAAVLTVSDTGVGMDEAARSRVFEPFYTTKGPDQGTGLGLSTVYGIVCEGGGSIHCASAPGKGTTFTVRLPLAAPRAQEPAGKAAAAAAPPRGAETILVVEDDPAVRQVVRASLEASGYTVLMADLPEQALDLARRHAGAIDLLLCDVMLPESNGPSVARAIAALRPGVKVLMHSGYAEEKVRVPGLVEERVPFIQKPFTHQELARRVREVLGPAEA